MKQWRFIRLFGFILCLLVCPQVVHTQQVLSAAFMRQDSVIAQTDTLASPANKLTPPPLEKKSGNTALLLSAILPGAGQIYAHRYYTIPLYWGLGTFFVAEWITCNHYYHYALNNYSDSLASTTMKQLLLAPLTTDYAQNKLAELQRNRDHWHDTRDKYAIYLALTYVVNLLDAYVGATLYSFDVTDNLEGTTTVQVKIPIH
jgi:hypothetical protein